MMRFAQFFRIDLLTYAMALAFFLFMWSHRDRVIDIHLHDTYLVLSYNVFHRPILLVLMTIGFIYTLAITLKWMPSTLLSWGFIGCISLSLSCVLANLFNHPPQTGYYTYHEIDNAPILVAIAFAGLFLIGILFFVGSLLRAKRM